MKAHRVWTVLFEWDSEGQHYERSHTSVWPAHATAMRVLADAAGDQSNGFDISVCTSIQVWRGDEIEVKEAP